MSLIFNFVFLLSFSSFMGAKSVETLKMTDVDIKKSPKDEFELDTKNKRTCTWEYNGKCYNLVEHAYSFYESWGYCSRVYGAYLVSISSAEEDNFLRTKLMEKYGNNNDIVLWIGASVYEGQWIWDDGEPWMYTAWNSAEPSGIGGFAGSYGASAIEWDWKEREENETSYFVCES